MAQIPYRGNLSAATFPITLSRAGRSVILPGADQNFDRRVDPPGDTTKNVGIPQAVFLENVLPTYDGYQSIGFVPATNLPPVVGGTVINCTIKAPVKDPAGGPVFGAHFIFAFYGNDTVRSIPAEGDFPAYNNAWSLDSVPGTFQSPQSADNVFWAHSQGKTYMLIIDTIPVTPVPYLYEVAGIAPPTFTDVTAAVTGLPASTHWRSITGAYNYLILNTFDTVYWSSLVNPLDFVASNITGAGFESVGANLTYINFLAQASIGFFAMTRNNVIACQYTGNRGYPWRFVPVENSGVVMKRTDLVSTVEADDIFVKTVRGQIQQIQGREAIQILNDVTDYLERDADIDSLTWATGLFTVAKATGLVNTKMVVRIWFVSERYLIISYNNQSVGGISGFQNAFVFDTMLRRLGKIKFSHTDIYDDGVGFSLFNTNGAGPYVFARVSTDINETWAGGTLTHEGIVVFGNFKSMRNGITMLEQIDIESLADTQIAGLKLFESKFMGTTDEVNFTNVVVPFTALQTRNAIKYQIHQASSSFRIGFRGQFKIAFIGLKFQQYGHEL